MNENEITLKDKINFLTNYKNKQFSDLTNLIDCIERENTQPAKSQLEAAIKQKRREIKIIEDVIEDTIKYDSIKAFIRGTS